MKIDHAAADWTPENCLAMARLAELAYEDHAVIEVQCKQWGFEIVKRLEDSLTDTQGFIVSHPDYSVLAFRGTEPGKLRDWLIDATVDQRLMTDLGNVHGGFRKAYRSVHDQIIDLALLWGGKPLFITGHSLGGALATLATYTLARPRAARIWLYTFGSPRVMDKDAAAQFNHWFGGRSFRMVNNSDPVARVPPRLSNYWHVDDAVVADADGLWNRGTSWWVRMLERVKGNWQEWLEEHELAITSDHKISEYVRVSELNVKA